MKALKLFTFAIIPLLMSTNPTIAQVKKDAAVSSNPLFNEFNKPMAFGDLKPEHFKDAATRIVDQTNADLKKIFAIEADQRTFKNTMLALDDIYNNLNTIAGVIDLMSNTLPEEEKRKAALEQLSVISKFYNELQLNEDLYKAVREYALTPDGELLSGYKKKFLTEVKQRFERNGFALTKDKRDQLKEIQNKISDIGIKFSDNIESYSDSLLITEDQAKGLPKDYLEQRKTKGGYIINLSYPDYYPFMKYCQDDATRKALYLKFNNRAPKNENVLNELLQERKNIASLLGYNSYAEYAMSDNRMAHDAETVWVFESSLTNKIRPKGLKDYSELLALKYGADSKTPKDAQIINPWEASFYTNKLLEQKYQVDGQKVKEYFELNNVLDGLFKITQHLFNLEFVEVKNPSVWHPDVRLFEVKKDGKMISRFYLDLYPRANKYGHAACFGIISGKMTANGYQYPTASLVCNFPKPTKDQPSLMPHGDVETFFHEFGHVLHNMLTTSELSYFAGTNVAQDFVEAPSQIFENWAWEYDALKLFAKHYKTGELLPQDLYNKMLASKNAGSGLNTMQQIFYGTLDMTLHDKFDPKGTVTTTDIVKELQNKITLYPYLDGAHFQYSFGHLNGYGAGYYGYLWSKVYAQDMFSIFRKNGIMDQKTGIRYRDIILSKGATEDPMNLVKEFLGREPNQDAYLKGLGL